MSVELFINYLNVILMYITLFPISDNLLYIANDCHLIDNWSIIEEKYFRFAMDFIVANCAKG